MAAEGNKTEKATPKKRRDERKKGNVFMSRDAVAVASLLGTFAKSYLIGCEECVFKSLCGSSCRVIIRSNGCRNFT